MMADGGADGGAANGAVVRVRRMRREDVARVMEIAAGLEGAPQWPEAAYAAVLDQIGNERAGNEAGGLRRIALVALGAEGVAGFAVASVVGAEAELESIGVEAARQRRGVGTRLLEALAGELLGAGAEELFLEVRASNQRALGLYRRAGFVETGRRARYYADPVEDAVLMALHAADLWLRDGGG
jgi:ribosomal-protein-alanine N-acetyltransferase